MSEWRPLTNILDIAKFHQMASYGLYSFRAKLVIRDIYDPEALRTAEENYQKETAQEAQRIKEQIAKVGAENFIHSIGFPIGIGAAPPWKKAVPIIRIREMDVELPFDLLDGIELIVAAQRSGTIEAILPSDPRIRALYKNIEYLADVEIPNENRPEIRSPSDLNPASTDSVSTTTGNNRSVGDGAIRRAVEEYLAATPQPLPSERNMAAAIRERYLNGFASRERVIAVIKELSGTRRPGPR